MVQRYDFCDRYGVKLHESENDSGEFVKYEDYAKLVKSVSACLFSIQRGELTVEHVQGYLEGVIGVLGAD